MSRPLILASVIGSMMVFTCGDVLADPYRDTTHIGGVQFFGAFIIGKAIEMSVYLLSGVELDNYL